MRIFGYIAQIYFSIVVFLVGNMVLLGIYEVPFFALFVIAGLLLWVVLCSAENRWVATRRLKICRQGCELLICFLISTTASIVFMLVKIGDYFPDNKSAWLWNMLVLILVETVVFWIGIIMVYTTSMQIGIKWRVIGIICGWIPVANIIALLIITRTALEEVRFETAKIRKNEARKAEQCCHTKFPVLMVHGVFFRDYKYLDYWGRIAKELEQNGAVLYYGNHDSASSVAESGRDLAERIKHIVEETGCEKVNIIAHSKGGLDSRAAISNAGIDKCVASLTTISTPHRGCVFAEYLLGVIPESMKNRLANAYNATLRRLGDNDPDFIAAVTDLTESACEAFNEKTPDAEGVYYQSVGSKLNKASNGKFPTNFSHKLVKYFDGDNDGLVSETSFPWGSKYTFLETKGPRGISHADMMDLNKENIKGFDVREFYVELVSGLKDMGM